MGLEKHINRNLWSFWHGVWESDTGIRGPVPGQKQLDLNYHRVIVFPFEQSVANNMIAAVGWTPDINIACLGVGFGWLVESLINDHGFIGAVAVETSDWIHTVKGETEEADINSALLDVGISFGSEQWFDDKPKIFDNKQRATVDLIDEDMLDLTSRNTARAMIHGLYDVIFTEFVMEYKTDAEAIALSEELHKEATPIVQHLVQVTDTGPKNPDFFMNIKSLQEWKDLLPNDIFIASGTYAVL